MTEEDDIQHIVLECPGCSKTTSFGEIKKFQRKYTFRIIEKELELLKDSKMTNKAQLDFINSRLTCPKCEARHFIVDWNKFW